MENVKMPSPQDALFEKLQAFCEKLPHGTIKETKHLEGILAEFWDDVIGNEGGMKGYKLHDRMESVTWNPPVLEFDIERHGGTQLGSTRAEIQHWSLDIENKEYSQGRVRYRQIHKKQPKLDVNKMAADTSTLIFNGSEDNSLRWYGEDEVRVIVGEILPEESACKQTLEGRRKRYRKKLIEIMSENGWEQTTPYRFKKK